MRILPRKRGSLVARKKTEQEIAFFCEKTRIEQKNQNFFDDSAAAHPLPNMHLSLSSLLVVGLGGRLDSTNIATPRLAVITQIDYDHERFLGQTLTRERPTQLVVHVSDCS